jgi:hypothetical protein
MAARAVMVAMAGPRFRDLAGRRRPKQVPSGYQVRVAERELGVNTAARLGQDHRFPILVSRSSLAATTAETGFA